MYPHVAAVAAALAVVLGRSAASARIALRTDRDDDGGPRLPVRVRFAKAFEREFGTAPGRFRIRAGELRRDPPK
ncbi:hypothetical protein [Nocardia thraciensis]